MTRNNRKIIRATTVPQSLKFCEGVMLKLREKGYDMVAISSPGAELDGFREELGFRCIGLPMARHISLFNDLLSLLRMIVTLNKERPQMIHSMTPKAGLICMTAGWITGVPVRVHTFTGLIWPTSRGLKRLVLKFTDRVTCACSTHVIPEGEGILNDMKNGHITSKPMRVLGYGNVMGVDLDRFNPGRFPDRTPDRFTFLYVGRIVGDKGINELVAAFSRLVREYPDIRLNLVGKLEDSLDPITADTREEIKANPAISADGPKNGDGLLEEYASASCFVLPSYREGFPNTVIEAGAMGLASIVTDINGSREIIRNGMNGLIVPSKDTEALFNAMKRLLTDSALLKKMEGNARKMVADRFEKNFVQQCLIDFYEEILGA